MSAKLYTFLFILLSITSCSNEKKKEKPIVEKSITFPYLKCDKGLARFLKHYKSTDPISYMEYGLEYFYIGKMKDTIQLDLMRFYVMPPPPVEVTRNSKNNISESLHKDELSNKEYYVGWEENHEHDNGEIRNVKIQVDTSRNIFNKYPLYLTNIDNDTIILSTDNGILISIQALDSMNQWKTLYMDRPRYCGNGLGRIFLPPNECAITLVPIFNGSYKTKFRLRYGKNFSNPYDGFMNYKLFTEIDYNSD